jgi:hypothetical protein
MLIIFALAEVLINVLAIYTVQKIRILFIVFYYPVSLQYEEV